MYLVSVTMGIVPPVPHSRLFKVKTRIRISRRTWAGIGRYRFRENSRQGGQVSRRIGLLAFPRNETTQPSVGKVVLNCRGVARRQFAEYWEPYSPSVRFRHTFADVRLSRVARLVGLATTARNAPQERHGVMLIDLRRSRATVDCPSPGHFLACR